MGRKKLIAQLLREIEAGAHGGPLAPLASQLSHDKIFLKGSWFEGKIDRLDNEVRKALTRLNKS